jgi:hypothetical protein
MRSKKTWIAVLVVALLAVGGVVATAGWSHLAVATAPKKEITKTRTEKSLAADKIFWDTLHGAKYEQIPAALEAMTAAYLENPNDDVAAAHVGWLHVWRLAERERMGKVPATITDNMMLARRYFDEAVRLRPDEARYQGFLASAMLAEGSIHKDEKLTRQGYFKLMDAVDAWPEFNLFTAGYVMSRQPADSKNFRDGLDYQWQNIDVCIGEKVDRTNPDFTKYMKLETKEGSKRVCWNSWIAPHNLEGFFLNFGDMLVKAGDWQVGQKMYANAKLSATYNQWQYRDVLEARIQNAQANVKAFNASASDAGYVSVMNGTAFTCMGCHQE